MDHPNWDFIKLAFEKGGYAKLPDDKQGVKYLAVDGLMAHYIWNGEAHTMKLGQNDLNSMYLDPLFWKALGKALDWMGYHEVPVCKDGHKSCGDTLQPTWLHHWHHFTDWVASGADPDDFFEQFTTKKL